MKCRLSDLLIRISQIRVFVISLLLFLLFLFFVLPNQSKIVEKYAGDIGSPDISFFYSKQDLIRMAEVYGEQGRDTYIRSRYTFDLIFPLIYTFFLISGISWLSQQVITQRISWRKLNLLPIAGMLFDFVENFSVSFTFAKYPEDNFFSSIVPYISLIKWLIVISSFFILIILLLLYLQKKRKYRITTSID
jgi:hypothetical protein